MSVPEGRLLRAGCSVMALGAAAVVATAPSIVDGLCGTAGGRGAGRTACPTDVTVEPGRWGWVMGRSRESYPDVVCLWQLRLLGGRAVLVPQTALIVPQINRDR